jgi:two-component system, cell cycle sensor histidine kinase and response regulator CckA
MILVVDDEPAVAALIAYSLKQNGFPVLTANNGADAIEMSRSHRGDIQMVITDVMLADIDGPTLIKVIAAEDPSVAVIYISGSADMSELPEVGRYHFLAKPFTLEKLLADLGAMLPVGTPIS